jgi:hypothetical protein
MSDASLPVVSSLEELARLVGEEHDVFVRWSKGPDADLPNGRTVDRLSGRELPGLSVNPLLPPSWWGDTDVILWVARKLHEYSPGEPGRGTDPGNHAWVVAGEVVDRGPDNEPLLTRCRPVAWIDDGVLEEAARLIEAFGS